MKICKLNECPFDLPHDYQSNTLFCFLSHSLPDLSSHPPPKKISNAHYNFCLWQLFFLLLMLTHIFFAFVQVITRFISCTNSFANSHSERGSSAIFGFEAFFSAPIQVRSLAPLPPFCYVCGPPCLKRILAQSRRSFDTACSNFLSWNASINHHSNIGLGLGPTRSLSSDLWEMEYKSKIRGRCSQNFQLTELPHCAFPHL